MAEGKKNAAVWDFTSEDPEKAALLKDALRDVKDPELGYSVIDLGLIRNVVRMQDGNFMITMILTTPFCPYGPQLIEEVREKAEKCLDKSVHMDFRMDMWDESMAEEGFDMDWGMF